MSTIELTGLKGLTRKITALRDAPFRDMMLGDIGMYAMTRIKRRTLKGEDVHGLDFTPYSKGYAVERGKRDFPVKPVDLTRTGSMLSAMTYDTNRDSVDIFFMNTQGPEAPGYKNKERNPAKAFFLHQDREFFELSQDDIKGIKDIVNDYYDKLTRG